MIVWLALRMWLRPRIVVVKPRRAVGSGATVGAAERRFEENDPEGVAFEYDVIE